MATALAHFLWVMPTVMLLIGPAPAPASAADVLPGAKQQSGDSCADEPESQLRRDFTDRYAIDSSATVVGFEVRSLGIFRQYGRFGASFGSVSLDPQAAAGTLDVVVDARTVQADSDAMLRIMRGARFLNVEKFPEISFKAEQLNFGDGKPIRVEGQLTLLGATHPVPLKVTNYHCAPPADGAVRRCMLDATAIFKRSEFGMTGSMALAGNKIRLSIHAEATRCPLFGEHLAG
jgi:polyisoprenoid-binding protein YceI